jgi:hypothetical protein
MTGPRGELLILPVGTHVVTTRDLHGPNGSVWMPRGAVGVILKSPADAKHNYQVRFVDGGEAALSRQDLGTLSRFQDRELGEPVQLGGRSLFARAILCVVTGSRAYGLDEPGSDTDRRGVYLPPAELHWSLFEVPEQIDDEPQQTTLWELRKFLVLALKANPNVLECLWSPRVEHATPLGRELLAMRSSFLSRLVYQTYNGYVMSQFKKLQSDLRAHGKVKWKHVMHLVRLQLAGIGVLRTGEVPVAVGEHRDLLLRVRRGEVPWPEIDAFRQQLHLDFTAAFAATALPERPDYAAANDLLVRARRLALQPELP